MQKNSLKLAVVLINYNQNHFIKECIESIQKQSYLPSLYYFVDNASTDKSIQSVTQIGKNYKLIVQKKNLGYPHASNIGFQNAFNDGADICMSLNVDMILKRNTLKELVNSYLTNQKKGKIGLLQPVILLNNNKKYINTKGNSIHFLGYGYCKDYLKSYKKLEKDHPIISVCGGAMLVGRHYWQDVGELDSDFFMYVDDQDYSYRGLLYGYTHHVASKSEIYHDYEYSRYGFKLEKIERNRVVFILKNYSSCLLILLLPIIVLHEIAVCAYSIATGWFLKKMAIYYYLLKNIGSILKKRNIIQNKRIQSDSVLINRLDTRLDFVFFENRLISNIINPIYSKYFRLVRFLYNHLF